MVMAWKGHAYHKIKYITYVLVYVHIYIYTNRYIYIYIFSEIIDFASLPSPKRLFLILYLCKTVCDSGSGIPECVLVGMGCAQVDA